nr:AEC family transporter [Pseudovibrio flavus]
MPIFCAVLIGYIVGKIKYFDDADARVINKTVFYVLLPPLLFILVAEAPFEQFDYFYVLGYLGAELFVYAATFCLARLVFKRSFTESLLLGMATAFCNHTFVILPIAELLHGADSTLPVISVIVVDNIILLGGTILVLEMTSKKQEGNPLVNLAKNFVKNPNIMALVLGTLVNFAGFSLDNGFGVYSRFLGNASAPCSLFALGIVLSQQQLGGERKIMMAITFMKLVFIPVVAWLLFVPVFSLSDFWVPQGVLVAAGPCGVLTFVLGIQYRARVDLLSEVILVTTFLSAFTITIVAALPL